MTASPAATTTATGSTRSGLRSLYVIRAAFSIVWVVLVSATTASLVATDKPSIVAAVLLVIYPLWDAIATLFERRLTPASGTRVNTINLALGLVATVAMVVAVLNTIGSALLVFGIWALLSGAIQLVVALQRRRTVGAQWPMIISGGLSVLAGATFAVMSASPTGGLSTIAGYSGFGAFWFLVAAIALTVRARRDAR